MEFFVLKGNKFSTERGNLLCSLGLAAESPGRRWWWSVGTTNLGFARLAGGTRESAEAAIVDWLATHEAKPG